MQVKLENRKGSKTKETDFLGKLKPFLKWAKVAQNGSKMGHHFFLEIA